MKKLLAVFLTLTLMVAALAGCSSTNDINSSTSQSSAPAPAASSEPAVSSTPAAATSDVPSPETNVGTMLVYDYGDIKLHAYQTNDLISNENFILETAAELILMELAPFYDNIEELQTYIDGLGKPLNSVIVAYHPAGGDAYPDATMYAPEGLGEAALVAGFIESFGDIFDGNLPTEYELVTPGTMTIGGVEFNVIQTADTFDLEIPAINVYITHMVGSNTHNILPSIEAIDGMIAQMKDFQQKNYSLILSGHDIPRTIEIAAEKIDYLETLKELAVSNDSAEAFIAAVNEAFPDYMGESYLEMSAGGLYAE